jgi:site-specific DNA recombinase
MLKNSGSKAVMPQMVRMFAKTARQRIRPEGGDRRRVLARRRRSRCGRGSDHRIEVPDATDTGVERWRKHTVPIQGPSWRREKDSNPR